MEVEGGARTESGIREGYILLSFDEGGEGCGIRQCGVSEGGTYFGDGGGGWRRWGR